MRDEDEQIDERLIPVPLDLIVLKQHIDPEDSESFVDDVFSLLSPKALSGGPVELGFEGNEPKTTCGFAVEVVELGVEGLRLSTNTIRYIYLYYYTLHCCDMKPDKKRVIKQSHLIQRLGKGIQDEEEEETVECRYGVLCAHLRARGECLMPHRKSHFLYLNIPPPSTALPDPDPEEEEKLSKRQRKEQKIMEKTIRENIDVEAL